MLKLFIISADSRLHAKFHDHVSCVGKNQYYRISIKSNLRNVYYLITLYGSFDSCLYLTIHNSFIIHNYLFSNENIYIYYNSYKKTIQQELNTKNNPTVNKISKVPHTQDTTQSLHNVTLQLSRGPLKDAQELLKSKRTL